MLVHHSVEGVQEKKKGVHTDQILTANQRAKGRDSQVIKKKKKKKIYRVSVGGLSSETEAHTHTSAQGLLTPSHHPPRISSGN